MIDFKGSIWLSAEDVGSGHDLVLDDRNCECEEGIIATQQYIRADLVTKWQPIETMPDRPGQVLLTTPNGCYNVGIVLDQWVFLWKTKEPVSRDNYSEWMPIPKVPE